VANTDYNGGGMGGALVSNSTEQCCAQCKAFAGCKYGVWLMNGNLPQCYLKGAAAKAYSRAGRYSCAPKSERRGLLGSLEATKVAPPNMEQKFQVVANVDGTVSIQQAGLCIDNNFRGSP
jgi:hypothetical protein